MFTINEDNSIYVTRGDILFFTVTAKDRESGEPYELKIGDIVRIKVYEKKGCENVVLQKDFPVVENTYSIDIFLTEEDTKIGEIINKHKDYWYEIEVNPETNPQTIIGYHEDGAAIFRLFPEGADVEEYIPSEEDFALMDSELDLMSPRPVQNSAIARAVLRVNKSIEDVSGETGKLKGEIAVERARIDNLAALADGSTTGDAELNDIRVGVDGRTHANAGEAVRKQVAELHDKVDQNNGVYALPLEYTAENYYFGSQPFRVPAEGMSLRVTEAAKATINGIECTVFAKIQLGSMENNEFVYDEQLTSQYAFTVFSNRTCYIPYLDGVYAKVRVIMLGNNDTQLREDNIDDYYSYTKFVKVYTGKPNRSGGLLGAVEATLGSDTKEGYKPDYNFRALAYKYQAMVSPLPLKYVRRVSCPANVWLGAKIYKFDPITRETAWIETLNYCKNNPCFGTECVIDFEKYGDNYFALLTFGKVPLFSEYDTLGYNGSKTATSGITNIGLDMSDLVDSIQVDWLPNSVRSDAWGGSPIVQRNIELLKMNKHKTIPAMFVNNNSSAYNYILGKDDFAGVFYGGGYAGGMFFYNVSPATYYSCLLNPNSNAYGDVDTALGGMNYGIMCSGFAVLTHGHPIPRSTFDMRYSTDIEGFELKPMNLQADLHKLKPYDIITQGAGQTGHSVLVTGLENIGDMFSALKIMEAATPATRENVFFLHNGAPYYRDNAEEWYQSAYDYMAISDPAYDKLLHDKANWEAPYTTPQKVMCNRGYGSVYIEGKTHPLLSIDTGVTSITITKDDVEIGTYSVADLNPTLKNGYNLVDIMDKVSAGTIRVYNNLNDKAEEFYIINVDDYSVETSLDNDYLTIKVTHPEQVKFINASYHCSEGKYAGYNAPMFFTPKFEGDTMKIPNRFDTDIGVFDLTLHNDYRDYVNVIYNTDYDTNTFGVDAENDRYI